jgi:2-polyprenyl-3-methyl-5-hydroxy-6-metoxy-1,4-benzoquinol methylase
MQTEAAGAFSDWVQQLVEWAPEDTSLPGGLNSLNLTLNRKRLAEFVEHFSTDSDTQDFLLLDLLAAGIGAEISSTGEVELVADLSTRPFRLWEYIWLYKALGFAEGGKSVLDLGGPASHVLMAAALSGNRVHSVDLNPRIVEAGRQCAESLQLVSYQAEVGDMRDLSSIPPNSVDRIVCCSVLEHLTGSDQTRALSEMARVLAPGGVIGLTFDYGTPAPGVNIYLPPPHEPPETADEVRSRYVHNGLEILGAPRLEDPIPGSLFRTQEVTYTMGALFLGKFPLRPPLVPAVAHRGTCLIPNFRIPDLIVRLHEKARRDVTNAEQSKAWHQAADERRMALEECHVELRMLYAEVKLREENIQKERAQSQALERSLSATMQALISNQEQRTKFLESEIEKLQSELAGSERELTALRNEGMLAYFRRRWKSGLET